MNYYKKIIGLIGLPLKQLIRRKVVLSFITASILITAYHSLSFLSGIDLVTRDMFFRWRHAFRSVPAEVQDIILVKIDETTLQKIKDRWPFPRKITAEVLAKISALKPRVIGFDVVFQGEDKVLENDLMLEDVMREAGNVVIASYFNNEGQIISGNPIIQAAASSTSIVNKIKDIDGIVRRAPIFFKEKSGRVHWSWESDIFFKIIGFSNPRLVTVNDHETIIESNGKRITIPSRQGVVDVNYTVDTRDVPSISYWRVLEGDIRPSDFRNKIVLIGLTALAFHDFHDTPLKNILGLVVNSNSLLTLLKHNYLIRIPVIFTWLLIFLSVWFILLMTDRHHMVMSFWMVVSTSIIYLIVSYFLLWNDIIWDLSYVAVINIVVFFFAVLYKQFQTALENIRLQEESVRDPLTGFYTRRFLEVHLKRDVKRALNEGRRSSGDINEVAVVMIDLDNFKLVNDTFGHQEGDRVLKRLGESIRTSVRKDELVCRYGGDEFFVILPDVTAPNAVKFSEKLRMLIASDPELSYTTQAGIKSFRVTASFGVASLKGNKTISPENLLKAADRALYRAKTGGRNQVCFFDPNQDVIEEEGKT